MTIAWSVGVDGVGVGIGAGMPRGVVLGPDAGQYRRGRSGLGLGVKSGLGMGW